MHLLFNMDLFNIVLTGIAGITSIGVLFWGAGYWKSQFSQGSKQENTEVVSSAQNLTEFWKEQAEGYKTMMTEKETRWSETSSAKEKEWNTKFEALTREIGELSGRLTATEKQRSEYEAILKDRDPGTKTILSDLAGSMKKIMDFMEKINTHMETQEKDMKIEGVISKTA